MNPGLKRVIIHEMGHFIAHLLNQKIYGLGEVDKIEIKRVEMNGQIYYGGVTIPIKPPDFDESKGVVNLPQRLAVLVYGCYFQCVFLKKKFETCFDLRDSTKNGFNDHQSYFSALSQFGVPREKQIILWELIKGEYFLNLQSDNNVKEIFNIEFGKLLIKNGNISNLDLAEMRIVLSGFLLLHEEKYTKFVEKIMEIIDWELIKKK